jgi:hypothetical protein
MTREVRIDCVAEKAGTAATSLNSGLASLYFVTAYSHARLEAGVNFFKTPQDVFFDF